VGIAAAGPVGVDHSRNIQPGPSRGDCCCWPGYVHIDGKKSLVCAHRWQEKLGVCTSMARKAWCVHIAGPVGADHSIELQPGPHGIPRWPSLVEFSQGIHQVLLLTMVAVTRGRLPGDPPSAAADHGGRHSWTTPRGSTKCCCWIPRWPSSYYRCPTTVVLLPVSYFPNALRTHKRTHCERMFDTHLLLLTMVAVTRGRLPGDPPSAAAGYHGGRHSWNAELSWVPIRTFDRSPPMGTVLTVDRLSFNRPVYRLSSNVWRHGPARR
jgi:hypothetical protein